MADLIPIEDARTAVLDRVVGLGSELVDLRGALGRYLAEPAVATDASPPFDNSAMDGYAVRAADTADAPTSLAVVDESRAGTPASRGLGAGEAILISTGAALPEGADAVIRVEDTDGGSERVEVRVAVELGRNIRRAGEDMEAGRTVLDVGTALGPAELGVLATVGIDRPRVALRPRLAVLGTGDELVDPGEQLEPGQIRNSNGYSVAALAQVYGADVGWTEVVDDDPDATRIALRRGLDFNLLVVCGGVSVGPHDHVRPALVELGVDQVFWGVSLRPGKPTYFGVHDGGEPGAGGTLVFGLPGNPVSAMVTFLVFVRPALLAMQGGDPARSRVRASLSEDVETSPGRTNLVRCRLTTSERGLVAEPTGAQGSHVLTSMLGADCLAVVPGDGGNAGDSVLVELLPGATVSGSS